MAIKGLFPYSNPKINTLLFDLDETLIHRNGITIEPRFVFNAMKRLKPGIPFYKFYPIMKQAVHYSKTHKTNKKNHQVFLESLASHSRKTVSELDEIVRVHLHNDFLKYKNYFSPVPGACETIELGQKLGYDIVIATNPSMPFCTVKSRLEWAGVGHVPFEYITNSENMTRCKPDPDYYRELLSHISKEPGQCLMIGNDLEKDLASMKAGILNFILNTPAMRKQMKKLKIKETLTAGVGDYGDLREWLVRSAEERGGRK
jgi:FMN phosphatase YigB (HAD superfamily)